jgi:hypothetical protein
MVISFEADSNSSLDSLKGYFFLLCLNEIVRPYDVPKDIIHECGLIYVEFHLRGKKDLFPLFGITLGVTTREELSRIGKVSHCIS